jgi:nucleotide-binding universal stress UspA family protein
MYETILVPTDGSEAAERTLPHALRLAEDHDATVHALYVVDRRLVHSNPDERKGDVETELEREGQAAVREVAAQAEERGLDVETEVRHGVPARGIVEYAGTVGADVIVIGPEGKSPREKIERLGSVSDRVVDDATTSVFVVKERAE